VNDLNVAFKLLIYIEKYFGMVFAYLLSGGCFLGAIEKQEIAVLLFDRQGTDLPMTCFEHTSQGARKCDSYIKTSSLHWRVQGFASGSRRCMPGIF
jgi:hypothetical protein